MGLHKMDLSVVRRGWRRGLREPDTPLLNYLLIVDSRRRGRIPYLQ